MGEISFVNLYTFAGLGDYIQKRDHIGVFFQFLDSLKMKTRSSIYFFGIPKNPQYCVITVSLGATTYITVWNIFAIWSPLFIVYYDESSLDPMSTHAPVTSLTISHCSYLLGITTMIPFP